MRPSTPRPSFKIVSLEEALRITGLDANQLRALPQVQMLTRVLPGGRRERAMRLPKELVEPDGSA